VLLFTPEVNAYIEMFEMTHTLNGGVGWVMWQRTALPAEGGVEDQPAKVMQAITFLAEQHNALIDARRPKKKDRREAKQKRG
jgi:hypothetical protein